MRAFWLCIVALGLAVSPAMAGTGAGGDNDSAGNGAANTAAKANPAPAASSPSSLEIENELQQLRDLLQAQSKQIQQQDEQLREQKEQMETLQDKLTAAHASSDSESSSAVAAPVNAPIGPSTGVISNNVNSGPSLDQESGPTPTSINIKGISLTPMGFFAAETVWRQKALASDVNTPFNSVPFDGSSNAHMSEFQASGRQSRIAMLVEGKLPDVKIGGYYEGDFLSAGTTSTPTESNSYTFRQRQFWAQAAFDNGITFTGGQMWSLLTETAHGMDNRTEITPLTIDAQYNVGFSWARQYGARLTKNFGNKVWLGFSVEQSTPTVTVHGNPTAQVGAPTLDCVVNTTTCTGGTYTLPVNLNPTFVNFLFGSFGTSGGLYNPLGNYGYNEAPDFVVKAVFEPGFGHYEIFGVIGTVHDRTFPCVTATTVGTGDFCTSNESGVGALNNSATTGGVGGNARWSFFAKHIDLGIHFLGGAGIGRYGSGTLADLTVHPDGTPVPIHNYQSLGSLILHPGPKLDIYMYVGGEYEQRTAYTTLAGKAEGYGNPGFSNSGCWTETLPLTSPSTSTNLGVPTGVGGSAGFIPGALGSCTGDTRNLLEGTLGFWYRFYKGPKGTFQYGMQYSNIDRNTWVGVAGSGAAASGQPHSDENEVFTSFRYYLP
jgi:hypothetical protein